MYVLAEDHTVEEAIGQSHLLPGLNLRLDDQIHESHRQWNTWGNAKYILIRCEKKAILCGKNALALLNIDCRILWKSCKQQFAGLAEGLYYKVRRPSKKS